MRYTLAMSDIHGCLNELKSLMDHYSRHWVCSDTQYVFCGDYIDRGEDSRGVIDYVENVQGAVKLLGNHEDMLLEAYISDNWTQEIWMQHYGHITMKSFKVDHVRQTPDTYIQWMRDLQLTYNDGLRTFVHAGIQRNISPSSPNLNKQFCIWARHEFMMDMRTKGGFVVHGHTPNGREWPDFRMNRLNLDTGCVFGMGPLCGAVFDNTLGSYPTHFINHRGKIIEAKEVAQFHYEGQGY